MNGLPTPVLFGLTEKLLIVGNVVSVALAVVKLRFTDQVPN